MAETKEVIQPWTYVHVNGGEHPDNKDPLTKIAVASDEAVQRETDYMNALYAKERASMPPAVEGQQQAAEAKGAPKTEAHNDEDLEEHTVPELKEIAAKKGVSIPWDANKNDIIKAIKKAK